MMNKCIKYKRIVLLSVIFIVSLSGSIYLGLNIQKQQTIGVEKENLQILANEKAAHVNQFLEFQKEKQMVIASMNVFKDVIRYPNDTSKVEIAKNRINELKDIFPGISLMSSEGIVAIGDIDLPGTDYSQHPYFIAKRENLMFTRYYDPLRKKDYYAIIGSIYNDTNKSGIIGRIAFDIELDRINLIIGETFDRGENLEVYLIDETGLLLSDSKYVGKDNKKGVLIQKVETEGAKNCLEGLKRYYNDGKIEERGDEIMKYKNYMGDEVYGAHAYVPSIGGCVIAEKNADEIDSLSLIKIIEYFLKGGIK